MIKLNLKAEPYWIDLLPGARVLVRPPRTSMMLEANEEMGGDAELPADAEEPGGVASEASGFSVLGYAKTVARLAIVDWEGIGDAQGAALEVTPSAIDAAMEDYTFYLAFQSKYMPAAYALVDEGNGSGPSPDGTTATAPNTAPDAADVAPNARTSAKSR